MIAVYRYGPVRNDPYPFVLWILCNPSIADAEIDDPTERRCWGFTSSWGFGKMVMVNVNPYRSTDPKRAQIPPDSVNDYNRIRLINHARKASLIICGWGLNAAPALASGVELALRHCNDVHHMGLTKNGQPKHPLYLPKETRPQLWTR